MGMLSEKITGLRLAAAWKALTLTCALWLPQSASALIVIDGKVVPAWPDDGRRSALGKSAAGPAHYYPHPSGTVYGLTLLVDFSDQSPAFTKDEVNDYLNLKGFNRFGNKGSVRDYYSDVSNGKVDFQNQVYGFYRAKNTKAYYEGGNGYERAGELVDEIIDHFDPEVDFSKFDNDKDGKVEAISIMYAGSGVTYAQGLWPHAGGINKTRDGVQLTRYMMSDMGKSFALYVFCHECGHMLFGWPDLYGVGDYCIMANRMSETNPVPINDFYRADQGWIDVVDIDKNTNAFYKSGANGNAGFRYVNPARPQECFFWSNWKNTDRRSVLKGKGLVMFHFDNSIGVNNPPNTLSLSVVQADGKGDLNKTQWPSPGSDPADYFYQGNGTSFGSSTNPPAKWNDGTNSGLLIHDISPIADTMTFYVGTGLVSILPGRRISPAAAVGTERGSESFDLIGREQGGGQGWRITR